MKNRAIIARLMLCVLLLVSHCDDDLLTFCLVCNMSVRIKRSEFLDYSEYISKQCGRVGFTGKRFDRLNIESKPALLGILQRFDSVIKIPLGLIVYARTTQWWWWQSVHQNLPFEVFR